MVVFPLPVSPNSKSGCMTVCSNCARCSMVLVCTVGTTNSSRDGISECTKALDPRRCGAPGALGGWGSGYDHLQRTSRCSHSCSCPASGSPSVKK
eukprot:2672307-Rhodomonas_salina.3